MHNVSGDGMSFYPRVLTLVSDMDACALWRNLNPVTELQRQGYRGIEWGSKDDDRLAGIIDQFDAVVLPRLYWPSVERQKSIQWFRAFHNAGKAIIYEMDDDMVSDEWVRMQTDVFDKPIEEAHERRDSVIYAFRASDGITVSSQRLATMIREYTDKPIKVVPNYIDLRWFKDVQKKTARKVHELTVGWIGGKRPGKDWELMAQAWARIAKRYPKVTFVVQGYLSNVITDNISSDRLYKLDWMPIDRYPTGLVNIDIGCCPLTDTKFNRAKTYIKAMEYAASGAAVVASPTVYGQIIEHGVDGYIANTVDEWEEALSKLIENYTLRHDMSKALLAKVRKYHSLENNAWRWIEAWKDIVNDYQQRSKTRILIPEGIDYYATLQ